MKTLKRENAAVQAEVQDVLYLLREAWSKLENIQMEESLTDFASAECLTRAQHDIMLAAAWLHKDQDTESDVWMTPVPDNELPDIAYEIGVDTDF